MVNDLRDLMRGSVADAPSDDVDVAAVVATGRRRRRTRHARIGAGIATLAAAAVVGTTVLAGGSSGPEVAGHRRTTPPVEGPVVRLDDAKPAVEGVDYDLLTTHEVRSLESEPSDRVVGTTADGLLVIVQDNVRGTPRATLVDPDTGQSDELPPGGASVIPAELAEDRLVFMTLTSGTQAQVEIFDRTTRAWSQVSWPALMEMAGDQQVQPLGVGPDDRLYLAVPTGPYPDGYELWSASLTDPDDVRDEGVPGIPATMGGGVLAWTDSQEAPTGRLHVRDLTTGEQTDHEVPGGEACSTWVERGAGLTALSQSCGTDDDPDERVVLLDDAGEVVVTVQGTSLGSVRFVGADVVIASSADRRSGTYVYDTGDEELFRVSDEEEYGPVADLTSDPQLVWATHTRRYGAIYHVAEWRG